MKLPPDRIDREKFQEELNDLYATVLKGRACQSIPTYIFYPETSHTESKVISTFCAKCPVHKECLFYALGNQEKGIWGGTPESVRLTIINSARILSENKSNEAWTPQMWDAVKIVALEQAYTLERPINRIGRPKKNESRTYPNPMAGLKP